MRIFEVHTGGEIDWMCANSFLSGLQWYLKETGQDLDDIDRFDEVPEEVWPEKKIIDIEEIGEDGEHPIMCTFQEYMAGQKENEIIASTAY